MSNQLLERGKISSVETFFMLTTLVIATAILFVPSLSAQTAGKDGWISILFIGTGYGIIVGVIIITLGKRFPGKTLVQYNEDILGRYLGKALSLVYIFWFITVNSVIVREFSDFLLVSFMPETPLEIFTVTLVLLAASAVRNGIEVIARATIFITPLLFLSFSMITGFQFTDMDLSALTPVLEKGILPVIHGSLVPMAWRGEIILLAMFLPFMNKPEEATKTTMAAVVAIGILLTIESVTIISVLGVELTANQTFPTFIAARYISVADFIERLEAIVMLMWVTGVVVKVAIFYYAAVLGTAQLFNLRDYKPVVMPIGIIIYVLSIIMFENIQELKDFLGGIWPVYAWNFELLIPAGLLLLAIIRGKGGQKTK